MSKSRQEIAQRMRDHKRWIKSGVLARAVKAANKKLSEINSRRTKSKE